MKRRQIKPVSVIACLLSAFCITLAANSYCLVRENSVILCVIGIALAGNLLPLLFSRPVEGRRLKVCFHGNVCLRAFLLSTGASIIWQIVLLFHLKGWDIFWSILICVLVEALLFWNGIISVYCSSKQLRLGLRVIGILCGPIPIAHLFALAAIIRRTSDEVIFESEKLALDRARAAERICATRYPLLMVHGVFFRDYKHLNYWGRIPKALEQNGATLYYGNHRSASSIEDSGEELAARIRQIAQETGCGKLNIIAHSKGGLDCRYAIAKAGVSEYVASLTTVNTPHRGCKFADYLLGVLPKAMQLKVAATYNNAMKLVGEENSDFLAAVNDLTAERVAVLNASLAEHEGALYSDASKARSDSSELPARALIYRKSVGSKLSRASGGKFPLNFSYHLAAYFDGPNDGLVSEKSFRWGDDYTFLTSNGREGVSHGDMIDLNRANIEGFDVREFYVGLVHALKEKGL